MEPVWGRMIFYTWNTLPFTMSQEFRTQSYYLLVLHQVAAIFKIAQSKNSPEIPSHPSEDAQSFVKLCLLRDPSVRPTASQLLPPPLHRKLKTGKIASSDFVDNPFPCLTWRYPPVVLKNAWMSLHLQNSFSFEFRISMVNFYIQTSSFQRIRKDWGGGGVSLFINLLSQ